VLASVTEYGAAQTPTRYVAFLDILGWKAQVMGDFDFALETYQTLLDYWRVGTNEMAGLESVRIVSDSILIVSSEVWPLLRAVNVLNQATLMNDCLLRGGVAFGRHVEAGTSPESHVVSEALVIAATHEGTVHDPCVVIDGSALPQLDWAEYQKVDVFLRPMLFFDGRWIVNPFSIMWGVSAATRVRQLREAHPEHSPKYDWFLRLYEAVWNRESLVP